MVCTNISCSCVHRITCHHVMAHPQVSHRADGLRLQTESVITLNMQWRLPRKVGPIARGIGEGITTHQKTSGYEILHLRVFDSRMLWRVFVPRRLSKTA
jgi:hypothetical protein